MAEADILIIGRGVAAYAMALALKKRGIKNILIAGREPATDENITETLPLAAYDLLCRLDLGQWVEKHPVSNGIISNWGEGQTLVREAVFEIFETSWQLNKAAFISDCHNQVINENIPCITTTHVQSVRRDENSQWQIVFKNGEAKHRVAASFVVDASGRNAVFARRLGVKKILFDQQVAVTGVFACPGEPERKISAFIEALPQGWCYSALGNSGNRFVSLFTDADILNDLKLNKKQQWLKCLSRSELFRSLAGDVKLISLSVCPAASFFTEPATGPGWLAIGDACYCIDPLTSGGLFHAFYSALSSADQLISYLNGHSAALEELQAANRLRFESYLEQRVKIYRSVTRFADCKYWERRHERICLSPNQLVQCPQPFIQLRELKTPKQYLSEPEWEELYALCKVKSPAHAIVSNFSKVRPGVPARRTIQALQLLIERELLIK
jgi:flavin-dependent dehydrogenase